MVSNCLQGFNQTPPTLIPLLSNLIPSIGSFPQAFEFSHSDFVAFPKHSRMLLNQKGSWYLLEHFPPGGKDGWTDEWEDGQTDRSRSIFI